MRRRLRKKLRRGEFDVPIVGIAFRLKPECDHAATLDAFLSDAVEGNGLQFGGGGSDLVWGGFLEPRSHTQIDESHLDAIRSSLANMPGISHYFVGIPLREHQLDHLLAIQPNYPDSMLPPVTSRKARYLTRRST